MYVGVSEEEDEVQAVTKRNKVMKKGGIAIKRTCTIKMLTGIDANKAT